MTHLTRLGGTAIAAVLALSATPALAQEVTPQEVPQTAVPSEVATPAETPSATTNEPAVDPLAATPLADPAPAEETAEPAAAKPTAKPAAKAKPASTPPPKSRVVSAAAAEPAATLPEQPANLDPPLAAAPIAPPQPLDATPVETAAPADDSLPLEIGAGLGLLALGGAAFAFTRRRRETGTVDDVRIGEPRVLRPTAPVGPEKSAFNWRPATVPTGATAAASGNWIERAYRGPSPENPFLSLKKRLRRAAFFDQRERAVRDGKAAPLPPMAGLPQRLAAAVRDRAPASHYGFSYVPA